MSAKHSDLVGQAAKWLRKKCAVVLTEMATTGEEPDAIGWQGHHSTLVECKASRTDFVADRQKSFRCDATRGIGNARYFLAPTGLINADELPPMWGLLEYDGEKVRCAQKSEHFEDANHRHEITLLLSSIRRIGQTAPKGISVKFYTFASGNRATLGIDLEPNAAVASP